MVSGAVGTAGLGGWQGGPSTGPVSAYEAGVSAGLDDSAEEAEQATNTLFVKVGRCLLPAFGRVNPVQASMRAALPRAVVGCISP